LSGESALDERNLYSALKHSRQLGALAFIHAENGSMIELVSRELITYVVVNHLISLHWLPINQRITYKVCLMMYFIHTQQYPDYMSLTATTAMRTGGTSFGQWPLVLKAKDPNEVR